MPYALFEDDQKLSKEFPTEEEVWTHAEEAGLVHVVEGSNLVTFNADSVGALIRFD
ncbi:hypothetical protein ABIB06_001859 [Bradyrhizobium sp. LB8.2]|uniref:hypothetical protein n=1 Tax=unclassified Bradyrhizobium TaxID=2631580 RepID=UPI003395B97C